MPSPSCVKQRMAAGSGPRRNGIRRLGLGQAPAHPGLPLGDSGDVGVLLRATQIRAVLQPRQWQNPGRLEAGADRSPGRGHRPPGAAAGFRSWMAAKVQGSSPSAGTRRRQQGLRHTRTSPGASGSVLATGCFGASRMAGTARRPDAVCGGGQPFCINQTQQTRRRWTGASVG